MPILSQGHYTACGAASQPRPRASVPVDRQCFVPSGRIPGQLGSRKGGRLVGSILSRPLVAPGAVPDASSRATAIGPRDRDPLELPGNLGRGSDRVYLSEPRPGSSTWVTSAILNNRYRSTNKYQVLRRPMTRNAPERVRSQSFT
jgi:hypothetical protein